METTKQKTQTGLVIKTSTAIRKADNRSEYRLIRSVAEARKADSISLRKTKALHGLNSALQIIIDEIISFQESVSNISGMGENQIIEAAEILYNEFGHYKAAEIVFIFNQARLGRYGKLYGKLDITDIGSWFDKYDKEKTGYCEDEIFDDFENRMWESKHRQRAK